MRGDHLRDIERWPPDRPGNKARFAEVVAKKIDDAEAPLESDLLSAGDAARMKTHLHVIRACVVQHAA